MAIKSVFGASKKRSSLWSSRPVPRMKGSHTATSAVILNVSKKLISEAPQNDNTNWLISKDVFSFTFEDFFLEDYNPYPSIKAPIAV